MLKTILSLRVATCAVYTKHAPLDREAVSLAMNQLKAHSCSNRWPLSDEVVK